MKKLSINENFQIHSQETGIRIINPSCPNCDIFLEKSLALSLIQNISKLEIFKINNIELDPKNFKFSNHLKKYHLTVRETEIIGYLLHGKTAREMAEITSLSRRTIEHYLENIKFKFKVKKKSELIEKLLETS